MRSLHMNHSTSLLRSVLRDCTALVLFAGLLAGCPQVSPEQQACEAHCEQAYSDCNEVCFQGDCGCLENFYNCMDVCDEHYGAD